MGFKSLDNFKLIYHTLKDNMPHDFYIPCLRESVSYKRSTAFFSSSALLEISEGIGEFVDNGGKMQLLVSPKLSEDDYEAIKNGYDLREKISNQLIEDFDFDIEFDQRDNRFELLAYMIAKNLLEIKIVLLKSEKDYLNVYDFFHQKTGIFIDEFNNKIAFVASANESAAGLTGNDEVWSVYRSWRGQDPQQACDELNTSFDLIWEGNESQMITIPFPEVIKNKLLTYYKPTDKTNFAQIDENYYRSYMRKNEANKNNPEKPSDTPLFTYQDEAVACWKEQNYRGVFSMATGTGKTIAAEAAICQLFDDKKRLIVVICCPTKTLVEQWHDELKKFNIDALICDSDVAYKKTLDHTLTKFRQKTINFFCIVVTNDTFMGDNMQDMLKDYLGDVLLIVDEAHNFGASKISQTMNADYAYRLALSATFERYRDDEGTAKLTEFFGPKCIDLGLEEAISKGYLCPYYYYPIPTYLNSNEYEEYMKLTTHFVNCIKKGGEIHQDDNGQTKIKWNNPESQKAADAILFSRKRILDGVINKFDALRECMENFKDKKHILVYSGSHIYNKNLRQVDAIGLMLTNDLGMNVAKFTAEEKQAERHQIIDNFKDGFSQAVVAINCLDEGIDIPAIETAFILASTRNPKQYIQRRGRVLRKYPGKTCADIYDFIVLPHKLGSHAYKNSLYQDYERGLVNNELVRMQEFSRLADNPSMYANLYNQIREEYDLDKIHEEDIDYGV